MLEAFRPGDEFVSNADLARRSGLPKSTITRLTHTLCHLGYLERGEDQNGYRLLSHILTLGQPFLHRQRIRDFARPLMQQLAQETRCSVALGVRDGLEMIFIERVRVHASVMALQDIGSRVPIGLTSMGRAYLAGLPRAEQEDLCDQLARSMSKEKWQVTKEAIEREIKRYARLGYCFGLGEWRTHASGVSVPIIVGDGSILSMNCGGLRTVMTNRKLDEAGQKLKGIARQILADQRMHIAER